MNFIKVKGEENEEILINLDNIVAVIDREGKAVFTTLLGQYTTNTTVGEVWSAIDTIQHHNHRIRIDGLKGENLNVKVVNK